MNRLVAEWVTDRNRVVMVNAPEKDGVPVPTEEELAAVAARVAATEVTAYEDAVPDAPLLAEIPAAGTIVAEATAAEVGATIWELSNGVRVILKPTDFQDDQILLEGASPGGTSLASDADFVAAATAATVVGAGGVGAFSLVELQRVLAGKAVSVQPYVSELYEGVRAQASPKDVETMFQLVHLFLTAPRRDSAAYLAFRARVEGVLQNRSASPEAAFQDTIQVTLTQHHHRTRPPTVALYREMDLERSMAFYRDRFADASDFTFVVVGSFDPEAVRPLVLTYVGGLPAIDRQETWRDVGIDPPRGVVEREVRRGVEPKSLTEIHFTGLFEDGRTARYLVRSLAEVLQIRLRERLREELGGTYSVGVSGTSSRYPDAEYAVQISFGSDPDRVEELVGVVFEEITTLTREGPTATDVEKVQEIQRRRRETDRRENRYWLDQLLLYDRYGFPFADLETSGELIDGLTPEAVRGAAARYLTLSNVVRVSLYPETETP